MAQGNNETSYAALLKLWYSDHALEDTTFVDNPLLAIVPKVEDVKGLTFQLPMIWGQGQGSAAAGNFATAQSMGQLTGTNASQFTIPRVGWAGSATMALDTYLSSQGDRGAFVEAMTQIIDGMLANRANDLNRELYGTGSGSRGQVANSSFSTPVLTLTVPDNSVFFEVGMQLDVAAAEFTGATRAYGTAGHGLYVISADYVQNEITVGVSPVPGASSCNLNDTTNGIPTIAQNDFIFRTGDRSTTGASSGLAVVGLGGWVVYGGPASNDSFFGVNRSASPQRMAGLSIDGTQYPLLEEAINDALSKVARLGGSITHILMPYHHFVNLQNSQAAKGVVIVGQNSLGVEVPEVGFSGLSFAGPKGIVKVVPDRSCPANRIFGIKKGAWQYNSLKKHINMYDEDDNLMLRQSNDIGLELRAWGFGNLSCAEPRSNFVMNVNP